MDYALSCDTVRLVAAPDRRDWERRGKHPMEGLIRAAASADVPVLITGAKRERKPLPGRFTGGAEWAIATWSSWTAHCPRTDSSRSCFRATREPSGLSSC